MCTPVPIKNCRKLGTAFGFTLIETLVTIGLVALLISLLVPAIGKASDRSREIGSSANLRSVGQIYEMYLDENRGLYPAPVQGQFYRWPGSGGLAVTMSHWQASNQWHLLFLSAYPWESNIGMYLAPGAHRDIDQGLVMSSIFPSYRYSASFLGHPKVWSGEQIAADEWASLEQSVRQSMVRYPSSKVLMWDVELPTIRRELKRDEYHNLQEQSPMLFADGHGETRIPAEAKPGVFNWAPSAAHATQYLHNTHNGVYGRDY